MKFNPLRPAIVGYLCRWCAYSAADRAGVQRMKYPPNIISIQVPCTGRLSVDTILTAFAEGADGVAILGCHVQDCHYRSGAGYAMNRTDKIREMLEAAGIDGSRLYFGSVSAAEADSFAEQVTRFTNDIVRLGPLRKEITDNRIRSKDAAGVTGR
ncbi:MAG: hydrogenase iron-sulfur subunit [Candidatus Thorarchaeota archaeon]|nr:hydrogenase iron-sulfur subunit [Candidatus Thorarchaeota archaeon]